MVEIFARRFKVATRANGMTDVLSPSQVCTFSDCEVRWLYKYLLGLPDPPTAHLALDKAIRTAIMINFLHKLDSKEDIEIEGVVGIFRRAWEQQQTLAVFCHDDVPEAIGSTGEKLVRVYMQRVAPKIWPAVIHQPVHGVIGAVRIRTELDLIDVEGAVIDIHTSQNARMGQMHRFELATCSRLAPGASGVVRCDILVARNTPQHLARTWEVTPADIRWSDALYPLAQHAMQRGYYMPNRNSTHCSQHCSQHQCPYLVPLRAGFWWRGGGMRLSPPHVESRNLHRC